jgi:hypothetical protein
VQISPQLYLQHSGFHNIQKNKLLQVIWTVFHSSDRRKYSGSMLYDLRVTRLMIIGLWLVHSLVPVLSKLETHKPELRSIPRRQRGQIYLQSTCHYKRCLFTIQQMLVTSLNVFHMLFPVLLRNRNIISSKCSSIFQNSLTEGVIDLQNMQVYVLRHFFE